MPTNEGSSGVSNCYVFKSRLQEYAQKAGLATPVYETTKEGPSHEPLFRSIVIVNDVRYDSLPGFYNRKAAEQSAAEIALLELAKSSEDEHCISMPVHETGLCKNLLQEYAQKMNYAIPLYECQKEDAPGRVPLFSCTAEIGGMRYIGTAAKTKKEAEIKAARTALLAIQSSSSGGSISGNSQLTVLPGKKREIEPAKNPAETPSVLKPKKARFKKKKTPKLPSGMAIANTAETPGSSSTICLVGFGSNQTVPTGTEVPGIVQMDAEPVMNPEAVPTGTEVPGIVQMNAEPLMIPEAVPTGTEVPGIIQMDAEPVMNPEAVEVSDVGAIGGDLSGAESKKEVSDADPVGGEPFVAELEGAQTPHTNIGLTGLVGFESNQTVPTGTQLPSTVQMNVELVMNPEAVQVSNVSPIGEDLPGAELGVQLSTEPKKEVSDANPVGGEMIECALTPCTNGGLQPLEGYSVASNGDEICNNTHNAGEVDLGDAVKGQVAMEVPSATAGSGESVQASVD